MTVDELRMLLAPLRGDTPVQVAVLTRAANPADATMLPEPAAALIDDRGTVHIVPEAVADLLLSAMEEG